MPLEMIKIAITGGIAAGKTTATKFFKSKGESYIFNADKISKRHLKKSRNLQKKIINIFGEDVVSNNQLDLKLLAEKAFSNPTNHKILNGIIWPEIFILINNTFNEEKKKLHKFFVVDAAVIFEANFQNYFDKIILITANKDNRINRAIIRKNIPLESIQNRISLQLSDTKKKKMADYIIVNNSDKNKFMDKLEKVYSKLL